MVYKKDPNCYINNFTITMPTLSSDNVEIYKQDEEIDAMLKVLDIIRRLFEPESISADISFIRRFTSGSLVYT